MDHGRNEEVRLSVRKLTNGGREGRKGAVARWICRHRGRSSQCDKNHPPSLPPNKLKIMTYQDYAKRDFIRRRPSLFPFAVLFGLIVGFIGIIFSL